MDRPRVTGTRHFLPFGELNPRDFELLTLSLVQAEGFVDAEHYGAVGNDGGRDVIAYQPAPLQRQRWYFQCKRYKRVDTATFTKEINKILNLPLELHPDGIVFVVACDVSADIRDAVTTYAKDRSLNLAFWARSELDNKLEAHPKVRDRFFGFPGASQPFVPLRDRVIYLNKQHVKYISGRSINIARVIIVIDVVIIVTLLSLHRVFFGSWIPPITLISDFYYFVLLILPIVVVWSLYGALPFRSSDGDCYVSNGTNSRSSLFGAHFGTKLDDGNYEIWTKTNECIFDGCYGTVYATYVREEKVNREGGVVSVDVLRGVCKVDPGHHRYVVDKLDCARPLLPN